MTGDLVTDLVVLALVVATVVSLGAAVFLRFAPDDMQDKVPFTAALSVVAVPIVAIVGALVYALVRKRVNILDRAGPDPIPDRVDTYRQTDGDKALHRSDEREREAVKHATEIRSASDADVDAEGGALADRLFGGDDAA